MILDRRQGGEATVSDPDNMTTRMATLCCGHCNRHVHVLPRMKPDDMGGFCRMCMKFICTECDNGTCTPFEKKLSAEEERDYRRRQYEMCSGY